MFTVCALLLAIFFAAAAVSTPAQTPVVPPAVVAPPTAKNAPRPANAAGHGRRIVNETAAMPAEKFINVGAEVNISLCVSEGELKINGWDRREVRAFVSRGGSQIGYTILQKSRQTGEPVWIKILGYEPSSTAPDANADECLSGGEIEIDVPRGATVNVKSRESRMRIDSVAKVSAENVAGDIFLNNIRRGVDAKTYEGGVTVENSSGSMNLSSTTGNIVALDVDPGEIGDIFKTRTSNGAIALRNINHRQIEAGSSTGSIAFTGALTGGGQYNFGTSNGSIVISIPENTPLTLSAAYGYGAFSSELPLEKIEKSRSAAFQSLSAQLGGGTTTAAASLKLTTISGAIRLRKQATPQ